MSHNTSQKLRILALHGYMQSAEKFREKTYPFQGKVKKYAEFVFVTAPHGVLNEFVDEDKPKQVDAKDDLTNKQSAGNSENIEYYAWYKRQPNVTNTGYIYIGIEKTFNYIEKVFEEQGPFDGIFGFSQGGCVVGLLCDLQERNLTKHVKFDFAIIASGFKYEINDYYLNKLVIPSLHIYGENDKQIPSEWSQNLIECFRNPVIAKHPGGHYIPGNATLKKEYDVFFKEQWLRKYGNELH